ncbi:MAG: hypothetical protein MGU50_22405 [Trichodesmium sp. MAG_R02]|nr:hypothetical protein [Trichodesmium sp. MAG_R02]
MGIISHGDYCDRNSTYITKHLECLTHPTRLPELFNKQYGTTKKVAVSNTRSSPPCCSRLSHDIRWQANK